MYEQLGRYRLLKLLATGGMGEVFLARLEEPGSAARHVVVKRILRHLAQDQGFIDQFLDEALLAGKLRHPNVAQVFGLEREGGSWFIAMEYVHGRSLRDVLNEAGRRELKVPPRIAVRIAVHALEGLQYAHELKDEHGRPLGILHRDVTPENLLVGFDGVVKLVDFGIARAMTGAETRVGRPRGKAAYMAPELTVSGTPIDRRADLYAMGIVLYEALTLQRPPNAPTSAEDAVGPRAPYQADPRLPDGLNALLERAMAPEPSDRFTTARDFIDALEAWLKASRTAVQDADVASFLVELFGRHSAEAPAVGVPLDEAVGTTEQVRVPTATTQPLSPTGAGPPRTVTVPMHRAVTAPPAPRASSRTQLIVALVVGGGTALLMGTITLLAVWPREPEPIPVAAMGPNDRLMPELVLTPGDVDAGLPVAPPPAVPRPPRAVPKSVSPVAKKAAKPGRVDVRVKPWAEVVYAGKSYGITPIAPIEVPAGTATFTLKNKELKVTKKVSVKVSSGKTVVLKADLFKER